MKEHVVRLGASAPLNGVLTEPSVLAPARPAVVLLNSGIMHHVGTCRISVKIARALAKDGTMALRFDHAGIGDSMPRQDALPFEEAAPKEVTEVLDYLQTVRGIDNFVLYGLCTGADVAYATALLDPRVVGLVMIDAFAYTTLPYYWHYYWPKLKQLATWRKFVANRLLPHVFQAKLSVSSANATTINEEDIERPSYDRQPPEKSTYASGLAALNKRHVHFYLIYTGTYGNNYCYQRQFEDMFPHIDFQNRLKVDYFPDCSHIIKEPHYQEQITQQMISWVQKQQLDPKS